MRAKTQSEIFPQTKMEMTMRNKMLAVLVVPLLAALTAQAAMASEHHRMQTKGQTGAIEQFRNSNAFAAPGNIAADPSTLDESAMTSGPAGH
jgi:hypothetical protein